MTGLHRSAASPPIHLVHLGLGNFFRAHQAWYTSKASDAGEWGIAAFTGRSSEGSRARVATLRSQEGLYTLITRAADGDHLEVVRSLARVHLADEHAAWLAYLANPQVHVVTTTVTEAGYLRDVNGGLDVNRPEVKTDIHALRVDVTAAVDTAPAKLVAGFAGRRLAAAGPLTIVPCDNLPGNGAIVARVIDDLATLVDPDLARWMTDNVLCATTMADRITPAPTSADVRAAEAATGVRDRAVVVTEPFTEWVISGEFAAGRPRWEDAGATFTTNVAPFEDRKLWMLNGAHSMLAYAGSIRGHLSVADAMRDATCRTWLDEWWDASSRHLSLPAADNVAYRAALIERFANTGLQHLLDQIASDGSQKLPIRVLPVLRREREAGRLPVGAVRPLAAWVCHLRGRGAKVTDSHAAELRQLASGPLTEAVGRVLKVLDPELAADQSVVEAVLAQARALTQT